MLQYHHSRSLESVVFGEIKANPEHSDPELRNAYSWLEKQVGFYPLFLSVGPTEEDIRMTNYQDNWRVKIFEDEYRKAGEFPNNVLFSFEDVDGVFVDYQWWNLVISSGHVDYQMTDDEKSLIFKPSWRKSDWLREATKERDPEKESHWVDLVTPTLYLPDAKRIWVRNNQTKKQLETMGFENTEVRRLLLEEPE